MPQPDTAPEATVDPVHGHEADMHPRSDLKDGIGWIVLGIAILVASLRMDRLEQQHINPYTVPGLLPGLLGIAMILLGGVLSLRSWRRGALAHGLPPLTADEREQRKRIWIVTGLCMLYGVVLVGHGPPFWLGSAVFVTGSILLLQWMSRDPVERQLTPKAWAKAIVIGLATGGVTHLVFQELFLVHLP
jgi:drug/metabolite transporter (DMT)-like permease